jgi:hypothetical protein
MGGYYPPDFNLPNEIMSLSLLTIIRIVTLWSQVLHIPRFATLFERFMAILINARIGWRTREIVICFQKLLRQPCGFLAENEKTVIGLKQYPE